MRTQRRNRNRRRLEELRQEEQNEQGNNTTGQNAEIIISSGNTIPSQNINSHRPSNDT